MKVLLSTVLIRLAWCVCNLWRPQNRSRRVPFRPSARRSGRIPAEPYPPSEYPYCKSAFNTTFWPESVKSQGSGDSVPVLSNALVLIYGWPGHRRLPLASQIAVAVGGVSRTAEEPVIPLCRSAAVELWPPPSFEPIRCRSSSPPHAPVAPN